MSRREKKVQDEEKDEGLGVGLGFDEKDEKKTGGRRQPGLSASNIPAPLLAPLFKIEIHLRWIGNELKVYAALINHYPYVLTVKARQRFYEYRQEYQREMKAFTRLQTPVTQDSKSVSDSVESVQKLLKRCTDMHRHLQKYLLDRLQMIHESFHDGADEFMIMIIQTLRKSLVQPEIMMPSLAQTLNTQTIREQCLTLEQQTSHLLAQWQTILSRLRQQRPAWDWSPMMRWRQHVVTAIQMRLQNINECWADAPLDIPLPSQRLPAEQYLDLRILSALLKPAAILPALERKGELFSANYHDLQKKIRALQQQWGKHEGAVAVRELRIVLAYERWLSYLQSLDGSSDDKQSAWERAVKIQRRLTIEKKAFFKQFFQQQPASTVIARLEIWVKKHPGMPLLLPALRREKQTLIAQVAANEARLMTGQTLWQRLSATIWLSLAQQPDYQLGELAFLSGVQQMDRLPKQSAGIE